MTKEKLTKHIPIIAYATIIFAISIILRNLFLPFVLATLYFTQKLIIAYLPSFRKMKITVAILTLLTYFIILEFLSLAGWAIYRNYPLMLNVFIAFIAVVVLYMWQLRNQNKNVTTVKMVPKITFLAGEIASLIVGLLLVFTLIAIPVVRYASSHADLVLSFVNNVDDSAHLSMINDRIQFNRGITVGSDATNKLRSQGMYPSAWHSATATIIKSFSPRITTGISTLKAYLVVKILFFFILAYFITLSSIWVAYEWAAKRKYRYTYVACMGMLSLVLTSVFIFDIFREGFFSFFPQLIGIPILYFFGSHLKNAGPKHITLNIMAFCWFLIIGLSLSWYLVIPSAVLAVIAFIWSEYVGKSVEFIFDLCKKRKLLIFAPILAVALTYISMVLSPKAVGFFEAILNPGGVSMYPQLLFTLVLASVVYILLYPKHSKNIALAPAAITIIMFYIFAMLLYFIQMALVGSPRYYFYKVLYLVIVAAIPVATSLIMNLLTRLKGTPYIHILLVTSLLSIIIVKQFVSPFTLSYIAGGRHLGPSLRESIYEQMGNYRESSHKIYYLNGYPIVNDNATMLMRTNERGTACGEEAQADATAFVSIEETLERIANHCTGKEHITVFMLSQAKPTVDRFIEENPSYTKTMGFEYISINPPGK